VKDLENTLKESVEFYKEQERKIVARLTLLPKGRIRKKTINRENYYYLQYRKGIKIVDEYIGKNVPEELMKKIEERKDLEIELKKIRKALSLLSHKTESVSDLTEPLKKIFAQFSKERLWDAGIEIIGSWCFILYQKYLFVEKYPIRTRDVDFLVPLPYKGKPYDIFNFLKSLGFEEFFNPDGSIHFSGSGLKIEFIAPRGGRGKPPYIRELSITPQILNFVEILLDESIVINITRGIKARVPSPASFLLHKLLIAPRWIRKEKREKDLKQAIYVSKFVLTQPMERKKLLRMFKGFSKSWKAKIKRSLKLSYELLPLEKPAVQALEKLLF
jgi:hypothetical protein